MFIPIKSRKITRKKNKSHPMYPFLKNPQKLIPYQMEEGHPMIAQT